jgi:hypothetical protein
VENFPLLDVVIGLALIYTFLSLLASELAELTVRLLQWRSKQLKRTIVALLGESSLLQRGCIDWKDSISGRVFNSSQMVAATYALNQRRQWYILYGISPQLFAEALLDVLQSLSQADPRSTDLENPTTIIAQFKQTLTTAPELSPQLRINLTRILNRLQSLEADPDQQISRLKNEIALWFENALIEPSEHYRLRLKWVSFLISLLLVIAFNVDSLYIIRRISENTATRAMVMRNSIHIQSCQKHLNSPDCVERLSRLMETTTLPVGWYPANRQTQFSQITHIVLLRTMGGWLLTSLAVAMGSRFWLQIFRRLAALLSKDQGG